MGGGEYWCIRNCKGVRVRVDLCVEGPPMKNECLYTPGFLQHRVCLSVKLQVCITPMRKSRNLLISEGVMCFPVCVCAHACAYEHKSGCDRSNICIIGVSEEEK